MHTTFEEAFEKVKVLSENFQLHSNRFMRSDYKEHEVREDFINPFFEALGWDVSHKHQRDPFRQEVKGEKTEKEGRVDYSFFKAPDFKNPVFFVEAKKPSVDIKNELHYLQTIKYSWNAGLPVSILTDFQQFHILDTRNKAKPGDGSAFSGDHKEFLFTDYADEKKFAEIYYTFSREAIEQGNLNTYVEQLRKPKGKATQKGLFKGAFRPVDEDFLAYIDYLREELAKALKKNNEELQSEELTEATQRIIDRLVFIRFLEDKEILDDYLVDKFGEKGSTWGDFISNCLRLNTEYNGVVFKKNFIDDKDFKGPDEKMFRNICQNICHLNTDYNFRYIPIHILGSIYERFLGKVVHATDKRVKIEEKPEVRKAGGVYYTPKYIVEYIVDNTIGKLIKDKAPKEIAKLRFADIACGSGSFLISVYEHLLDYHTLYYNQPENIVAAQKDGCRKDEDGVWQLSIEQKQSILTNNVYGVDIDAQAVEVTQLSLYLKMLENENEVTVAKHLQKKGRLFGADKILPDLSNNIKCGNSLIGTDILNGQLFDHEALNKLNPFDYEEEFKEVFKQGGFDAIVGNPPYGAAFSETEKKWLFKNYAFIKGQPESYEYFIALALKYLKKFGTFSFIVPTNFTESDRAQGLRYKLLSEGSIETISNFRYKVWKDNASEPLVLVYAKDRQSSKVKVVHPLNENEFSSDDGYAFYNQQNWFDSIKHRFLLRADPGLINAIEKKCIQLKEVCEVSQGIIVYKTREEGRRNLYIADNQKDLKWKKLLDTHSSLGRYSINWGGFYLKYGSWLWCPREDRFFEEDKILFIRLRNKSLSRKLIGYYDTEKFYNRDNFNNIILRDKNYSLKYILGLFNSTLVNFWYKSHFDNVNINPAQVNLIPVVPIDFSKKPDKSQHDHIVTLVDQMLESKKKLNGAVTDKDKEIYTRKCEALDKQIDDAVFELYGLTEEEKQIVLNS